MAQVYILWLSQSFRQTQNTEVYTAQEIAASLHPSGRKIHFPSTNHFNHDTTFEHQSLKRSLGKVQQKNIQAG